VLANICPNQPPLPPSTFDESGSHAAAESHGADSASVAFLRPSPLRAVEAWPMPPQGPALEASATSRFARVFFLVRRTLVANGSSAALTRLFADETDTIDGALMLTTAEELEEQWLTMIDCTEEREGWDACESVSESDRFAFGAPPASCWRIECNGGRLRLGELDCLDFSGLRTANCASHSHLTVVNSCSRTACSRQPHEGQTNVARTRRPISPLGSFGLLTRRNGASWHM